MSLRISALCVVLLGGGCMTGEAGEPQLGAVQQNSGGGCDEFMCGTNSPQISEFGFWELNRPASLGVLGVPNNVGMQVYGFVKGGGVYLPEVRRGRLIAIPPTTAVAPYNTALFGPNLIGGALWLLNGSRLFQLKVSEVGTVKSWAQPADGSSQVMLESYKLDWTEFINGHWGDFRNMCKNPPSRENPDALTMIGPTAFHTLLFEGDRIAAGAKVDTGVDNTWFNLGCAGSALAKMALTGHTQAARNAQTFTTTLAQRTTMLKMLAADYCGDGKPFTVGGQPLNWRDDAGTMKILSLLQSPPHPVVLEARWNETGAACLSKPRVDVNPTPDATAMFGADVYDQVQNHCPAKMLPDCADGDVGAMNGYHLLSATPI